MSVVFQLNKLESPSPKDGLYGRELPPSLCICILLFTKGGFGFGLNWLSGLWEKDCLTLSMYFGCLVFICPWKKAWPFIWTNLNPLHPRRLDAKLVENVKVYKQTNRKMDRRTTGDKKSSRAFGSDELKGSKYNIYEYEISSCLRSIGNMYI